MPRSGPTPFGYKRRNGRLVPEPDEARIRVSIYDLFIEHRRRKTVADIINADGHSTRNGAMFSGQTIGRLLKDNRVTGMPGQVDALIGHETYEKCQAILRSQKNNSIYRKPRHVFAGLTFCKCGGKMPVPSKSKKYTCKQCKDKIYASDLEAIFVDQLTEHENRQLKELARRWDNISIEEKISIVSITTKWIEVDKRQSRVVVTFLDI